MWTVASQVSGIFRYATTIDDARSTVKVVDTDKLDSLYNAEIGTRDGWAAAPLK